MPRDTTINGTLGRVDRPVWQPLLDLVGEFLIGDFMWMHEIELDDGSAIHAYKHSATRRYLHLHEVDGRAFVYLESDRYRVIDARDAIDDVFHRWEELVVDPANRAAIRTAIDVARDRAGLRATPTPWHD
jgi:hypothetical protein